MRLRRPLAQEVRKEVRMMAGHHVETWEFLAKDFAMSSDALTYVALTPGRSTGPSHRSGAQARA